MNITLHCSITGLNCYRLQNENQRITVAKLTLPDISDNDSKSVNVTSETHPVTTETDNTCDLMNNDQDAISSDTSVDDLVFLVMLLIQIKVLIHITHSMIFPILHYHLKDQTIIMKLRDTNLNLLNVIIYY